MDKFSRGQIFASHEFKNFAWIKFRESVPFSPNFLPFPKAFRENSDFKFFAWIKFRKNPLKVNLRILCVTMVLISSIFFRSFAVSKSINV